MHYFHYWESFQINQLPETILIQSSKISLFFLHLFFITLTLSNQKLDINLCLKVSSFILYLHLQGYFQAATFLYQQFYKRIKPISMQSSTQNQGQLSTTSPSLSNSKVVTLTETQSPIYINDTLCQEILIQFQKNKQKYEQILKDSPNFCFNLYTPNLPENSEILFNQEVLDKQLDMLIKDAWKLDKELNKIDSEAEQKGGLAMIDNIYEFLRTSWNKQIVAQTSMEKLQQINRKVGCIKGQIKKAVEKHEKTHSAQTFEEIVKNSKHYMIIKLEKDQLLIERQSSKNTINQLKEKVKKLTQENQRMSWDLHLQRQKIGKLEQKLKKFKEHQLKIRRATTMKEPSTKENISENGDLQDKNLETEETQPLHYQSQIQFLHKSREFVIKIHSKQDCGLSKIQTSRTLNQIHEFLTSPSLSKYRQPINLGLDSLLHHGPVKMSEHMDQIMAFGLKERQRIHKNRLMRQTLETDPDEGKEKLGGTERKKKEEIEDFVSQDSKRKRFFRSPKADKKIRYQLNS